MNETLKAEEGFLIRVTVRNIDTNPKVKHLIEQFKEHEDRIEMVEVDLSDVDAMIEACKDCQYVLHSATPFGFNSKLTVE